MSGGEPIVITVDDDAVRDLLPRYLERRRLDVDTLRGLLAGDDLEAAAQIGHRLRGSGLAYGIALITEIGAELDRGARAGDAQRTRAAIDRLADFVERATIG
jgi:HPt (histidine-containing phosphotransfer) domain-containing protein